MKCIVCGKVIRKKNRFKKCKCCKLNSHLKCIGLCCCNNDTTKEINQKLDMSVTNECYQQSPSPSSDTTTITTVQKDISDKNIPQKFQKLLKNYPNQLNGLIVYGKWVDRTLKCGHKLTIDKHRNIKITNFKTNCTRSIPRLVFLKKLTKPNDEELELVNEFKKSPLVLPVYYNK